MSAYDTNTTPLRISDEDYGSSAKDAEAEGGIGLDEVVSETGGFGCYQLRALVLAAILQLLAGWQAEYVFTANRIPTRCLISECESAGTQDFSPSWITNAIPTTSTGGFDGCQRFANTSLPNPVSNESCPADLFNQQTTVACQEYVYENTYTVVYDFGLACDEWRRSLIGSIRKVGTLVSLPITGYISDRWGRRVALVANAFNSAWLGLVRLAAQTYAGFVTSQFMEAVFGAGIVSCVYILMLELVGPQFRVSVAACLSTFFAVGQVLLGVIAWALPDWRQLTIALYVPHLFTLSYLWIMTESVRWYMSKGRYEDAENILKNMARVNRKEMSESSLLALKVNTEHERRIKALEKEQRANEPWLIVQVFQHNRVLVRCIVVPVWWVAMTFVYYGLSINAVNLSGNQYVNYMAVSAVEIPGFWSAALLLSKVGRKPVLVGAFWICAASQFAYLFLNVESSASLAVYLVGKLAISSAVTALYTYTAELFPTACRHRLLAYCSMLGRLGAILAPLTPAFGERLPFILFGSLAAVAGLLALTQPETMGRPLADSLEHAL